MGLDLDFLSDKIVKLYNDIIFQEKIMSLGNLKSEIAEKKNIINMFRKKLTKMEMGKNTNKLLGELEQIEADFNSLYDNFDDKLMIFIIGNGNVGKSTLLNALVGYQIAETNFLPNTWKIDVYSPESDRSKAVIKYASGNQQVLPLNKAQEIIKSEEQKSKESRKVYNENLNNALKGVKIKEEREEIRKYLAGKHLYKSKLAEVRWPVEKNWILEKCLLVDTPGLKQNLYDFEQLGNIHDYYHKADGVLWLLDGQTIASANPNLLFEELDNLLENVGGVRDNIVGVINRMDMVRENGGEEAAKKVIDDAHRIFGNKFHKIVDISAYQAFKGIESNRTSDIEKSGILNLQKSIRDIFIAKSENIKNSAKIQGHNKLFNLTINKLEAFESEIEKYESMYIEKEDKLKAKEQKLRNDLIKEIDDFFETYLNDVSKRVDIHIDALADGKGADFVKNRMYNLDEFIKSRNKFLENKQLEIKNSTITWEKFCKISEYKYIKNSDLIKENNVVVNLDINLSSLNDIAYFNPKIEEDLFSFLGNIFGKAMFWVRKGSIKNNINSIIRNECNEMKEDIIEQLNNKVDANVHRCKDIIDATFENILFYFENLDFIKNEIKDFKVKLNEEKENIKLKDIIL